MTVAQRQLIAAYVSALNACQHCAGVHAATAAAFGVDEELVTALIPDVDAAPVEDSMRPVLRLVRPLTMTPARARDAEIAAVYVAGWDEQSVHDAVSVCAPFNFMNRLVEGLGIVATPEYFRTSSRLLAARAGYAGLRDMLTASTERPAPRAG